MFIARKSLSSGKVRSLDVPVTVEALAAYELGETVEKAFPRLSLAFREYIISGMTRSEWIDIFGEDDAGYGRSVQTTVTA